jgi:YD repeat-containing protein
MKGSEIGTIVTGVSYHLTGRPKNITYASGTMTLETPDAQWRPARIRVKRGLLTLQDSGSYAYDGLGRITAIGGDAFAYDSLSRLTHGWVEGKGGDEDYTFTYGYDLAGNMTSRQLSGDPIAAFPAFQGFDHDGGLGGTVDNRINESGFSYDPQGNLTGFVAPGSGQTYDLEYDAKNRPARLGLGGEGWGYKYLYDHRGRRVVKVDLQTQRHTFCLRDHFSGQVLSEFIWVPGRQPWWKRHNVWCFIYPLLRTIM